ncbi:hypothetical protein WT60_06340 [Burkholderia sp. MSMB617WGS]|uniref:KTSC domain-containing protein n=2 Tax=Burkholderia TaxID=32008 RepID=A0ABR5TKT0_9BURK|nr:MULTISPECIES: hypothetical protein [Burkholderia]AOK48688.1 hypothetical protein WT60_06340 [Burkholderia sp. MSMB617WGS]KVG43135.1 hypothetical protein WS77_13325 [Burkholderia sp. MSMB0265]KVG88406.1 hypothetical protein WS81_24725 [Burkholderia sp. MSMB2040]KVG90760.1 hypothetical protein WS83_15450 [Burkholderia sp. MSMB2042]KVK74132.1 hypothetical protein WS91_19145 [Burkholderia sp. MSMB1498]
MKIFSTIIFSVMMLFSSYASADIVCKSGKINKIETDSNGNLVATILDASYSFSEREVFPLIYSAFSENRDFYIYGNTCYNGAPASHFAIR